MNKSFWGLVIAAGSIFGLALGIRTAQPLFISPINSATAMGYATISLGFAIAPLTLMLSIGVISAAGASTFGPAQLASAVARWIPEAKRSVANGIIGAGGSFGQFLIIPLAQLAIGLAGWQPAMIMLGLTALVAVPLALYCTVPSEQHATAHAQAGTLRQAVHDAIRDPSFLLLTAGFFTCGFHIAFIATHLPGYVALCQLPATVSAWSLSIIGLFNMFGSLWVGKH